MHSQASPHGVPLPIQKLVKIVCIDAASSGKCQEPSDEIEFFKPQISLIFEQ